VALKLSLITAALVLATACGARTELEATTETSAALTVNGNAGFFICDVSNTCITRTGDATGDVIFASPYQGLQTQRWVQVNNCGGTFCFPVYYESPTKPGARIGISTSGQFQMTTLSTNWLQFRPMTGVIFNAFDFSQTVFASGAPNPIVWSNSGTPNNDNVWNFVDAPLLLVNETGASSTGTTAYAEYQRNGQSGTGVTFVNGTDNCMFAPAGSACTWTGNSITSWQGTWAMVPTIVGPDELNILGADVRGNVTTYWDSVSTTFKAPPAQDSEGFAEGFYPGTTHLAIFEQRSPTGGTYHICESTFGTRGMTVCQGDPGGFGGNLVFAVPGSGN
jgi:hypothetical protein